VIFFYKNKNGIEMRLKIHFKMEIKQRMKILKSKMKLF